MEQYINKSALVAEIERRKKIHFNDYHIVGNNSPADYGACNALTQILAFIDTLEVKEMNLEKEVDMEDAVHGTIDYPIIGCDFPNIYPNYKELKEYCDRKGIRDNDKVKLVIIKDV